MPRFHLPNIPGINPIIPDRTRSYSNYLREDTPPVAEVVSPRAFTCTLTTGTTGSGGGGGTEDMPLDNVLVTGGNFTVHHLFRVVVPDTGPIELLGEVCYVYLSCYMYDHTVEVLVSTESPFSTTTHIYIPLAEFTYYSGDYRRSLIHHDGDVNLGAYIR